MGVRWQLDMSTEFGAFLDPVADKLMVSTVLILLAVRIRSQAIPLACTCACRATTGLQTVSPYGPNLVLSGSAARVSALSTCSRNPVLAVRQARPPAPLSHKDMAIPVVIMIGREITMSALREWAAASGGAAHRAAKVNTLGKYKTALQARPRSHRPPCTLATGAGARRQCCCAAACGV